MASTDYHSYQLTADEVTALTAILQHFEDGGKSVPSGVDSSDFDSLFLKLKECPAHTASRLGLQL